jgi:hypothetical protein
LGWDFGKGVLSIFRRAFEANKGRSDGKYSSSMENLEEDGEPLPPKKHLRGWRVFPTYFVSTP